MKLKFYTSRKINQVLTLLLTTILFFSCQKVLELQEQPSIIQLPSDITSTTMASIVSGFVTDETNTAVKDASVKIGSTITMTDKYGYFEARNVTVVKNAAVVSVSKTGFFKGIKTFIATPNKGAFFRIKLIPKISAGTISGTSGGGVTLSNGLTITLPANAVVNATTNAAYSGVVTVFASYINPTATDINNIMPGDLRGLNNDNQLRLLTSFGMAAVELIGAGGELLQISSGKKATLTMPIPTSISASAPSTIPLWYFNENNGLWKQEGSATKVGNTYAGEVSHFSFWNCDIPSNYVQFNCTVVNSTGQPMQNAFVKISLVSNSLNAGYGYTDSSGYVSGAVPNNEQLKLEVFAGYTCGTPVFSQNFTTTTTNVAYGNVTINTAISTATLVGSVKNCAGNAVSYGFIIIQDGFSYSRFPLTTNGTYSINKLLCNPSSPTPVILIGEDLINAVQSTPLSYTINLAGLNNVPDISACGAPVPGGFQPSIGWSINGVNHGSTATDSNNGSLITITGADSTSNFTIQFPSAGLGVGVSLPVVNLSTSQFPNPTSMNTQVTVNIVQYGAIGQVIQGLFNGQSTSTISPFTVYNISGQFAIIRTQ
jgi:hypothetical protein